MERSHAKGRQAEIPTTRDDPAIGRWGSVNPLAGLQPDMSPYHYTHNNPINRIDPFGLSDEDPDDEDIPYLGTTEQIIVVAKRLHENGYIWDGSSYFLVDENLRELYEEIRDQRRSITPKIIGSILSLANIDKSEKSGIIFNEKSATKIAKDLTRYYRGLGVPTSAPNIKDFIMNLAISIASDPATNLIGPDLNSIYKSGKSGIDTTYRDVGVQRTIKTIHYYFPQIDSTIHIDYNF